LLDRYQFVAESLTVLVDFGTGFDIELGDVVILDGRNLKITDTKAINGTRNFQPRLFEVQSKTWNISGQPVQLYLVDTAFSLNGRYGIVSPSSIVKAGSTTTNLKLNKSYGYALNTNTEGSKYQNLLGYKFKVRSVDHSFSEVVTITAIDPADSNAVLIDPPLSVAPPAGYILEVANYSTSLDPEDQSLIKSMFVFWNNQVKIVSGISMTQFTVSLSDVADMKVGQVLLVHDRTYSTKSPEVLITDITGTTVTVASSLGFVPSLDDDVELLGFVDGGQPYRFI